MRRTFPCATICVLLATPLATAQDAKPLPGTKVWEDQKNSSAEMVAGIARFLDRELATSIDRRREKWKPDFASPEAYVRSIASNRERFAKMIGAVDPRANPVAMSPIATTEIAALIAETETIRISAVRWSVFDDVEAEGLLLEPTDKGRIRANVVVMGDADDLPESLAGLAPGLIPKRAPPACSPRTVAECLSRHYSIEPMSFPAIPRFASRI